MEFKERLRDLRLKKHMKSKEVAQLAGVSDHAYISYENRGSQPPYDVLIRIADVFDVSLDYLIGRNKAPHEILLQAGFSVTRESNGTFSVKGGSETNKCYQISANAMKNICEAIQVMQYGVASEAAPRLLALASRKD